MPNARTRRAGQNDRGRRAFAAQLRIEPQLGAAPRGGGAAVPGRGHIPGGKRGDTLVCVCVCVFNYDCMQICIYRYICIYDYILDVCGVFFGGVFFLLLFLLLSH